jgi:hypothetical protein
MKSILYIILLIIITTGFGLGSDWPVLKGPYLGQKPPGMTPKIFAPRIVSTHKSEGSCAFFERGNALLISRWIPFEDEKGLKKTKTITFLTLKRYGKWDKPVQTEAMGDFTPSPDGKQLFVSARKSESMRMGEEFPKNFR